MLMKKTLFATLFTSLLLVASCNKPELIPTPTPTPTPTEAVVIDSGVDVKPTIAAGGGEAKVSFKATSDWTASIINTKADSWISLDKTSGSAGSATITIKTTVNDTPDDRNATVQIKAGSTNKDIVVTQKGKDALTTTPSKTEFGPEGGDFTIEVKANIDFTYSISDACKDWISEAGTKAMTTRTLKFTVAPNEEPAKREGSVTIKSSLGEEVIKVYQSGSVPTIILTQNEYAVKAEGETIQVEVKSNIDVDVEIPESNSWIITSTTKAMSTNTFCFDIAPTEEVEPRTGEIRFINKANNLSEKVIISQVQKNALVIAQNSYQVSNEGGNIEIEVGHNVDFDIAIADSWVTQASTKAFTTDKLVFNVETNTSNDNRETTITFSSKDNSITQVVRILQGQIDALILSETEKILSSDGGYFDIEINHNVDFNVVMPSVDWISEVETKALSSTTKRFYVAQNDSYEERSADIVIQSKDGKLSDKITVTQLQKDVLVIAKPSYHIPRQGGGIEIEVGHNIEYTVSIDQEWVANWGVTSTKAYATDVILFYVSPLPDGEPNREATITFTSSDGNKKQEIIIKQGDIKSGLQSLERYTTLSRDQITAVNFITGSDKTTSMMTDEDGYPIYGETVGTTVNIYTSADKFVINLNPYVLSVPYFRPEEIKGYFEDCTSLQTLDLRSWDTSISDNMSRTFLNCQSLEKVDVSSFDTRNVTSMNYMFSDCHNLSRIDLSNFETPELQDMSNMFANHYLRIESKLESLDLSNFDTSNLTSTYCMLQLLVNLKELNLTGWKSKVDNVDFMLLSTGSSVTDGMNVYCDQDLAENLIRKASSESSINWIVPGGFKYYESSDYSRDGKVSILNKATVGNGVNIFLFGDGFADKDIADGTYEAIARQAMEGIFAVEPFKSCRDMFNVYMVEKVSKNNLYINGAETAFSANPSSNESGGLSFDSAKVEEEVRNIVGESEVDMSTAVLFVHHYSNAGCAFLKHGSEADLTNDYAGGFGVGGACLSYFESTLRHEFGHAFAKLDEEYVIFNGGRISEESINAQTAEQNNFGWWTNIDFTNNLSTIRWTDYVSDSRYASEHIGAYEGAGTYESGVWRPTEDSIMNTNNGNYNAPSRETIYRRINKLAYGSSWEFDRETFKLWDLARPKSTASVVTSSRMMKQDYPEVLQKQKIEADFHVIRNR